MGRDLQRCARAIGTKEHKTYRLDGIQPDLIGEFFVLEVLAGLQPDPSPYLWLPRAIKRADHDALVAFVRRVIRNFPDHPSAVEMLEPFPDFVRRMFIHRELLQISAGSRTNDRLLGPEVVPQGRGTYEIPASLVTDDTSIATLRKQLALLRANTRGTWFLVPPSTKQY